MVPRAVLSSVGLTAVWFVAVLYIGTIGFGASRAASAWGADPNGLATLAHRYVGSADATLIELGVLLDMVAAWMAFTNSFSRSAYALASAGSLPAALGRTSRRGVPWVGNVTWIAVTLVMLLATALAHVGDRFNMLSILVLPGLLTVQATYALLALVALKLLKPGWGWAIALLAAVVPLLGIYGTIHPFPSGVLRWGVWLTLAGVGVCVCWYAYALRRRPCVVASLAPSAGMDKPAVDRS